MRFKNFRPKFNQVTLDRFRDPMTKFLFRISHDLGKKFSLKDPSLLCKYTLPIPNFCQNFRSISYQLLEIRLLPVSEVHMTSEKNFQNPSLDLCKYALRVPNFRPFRSISYRFRDNGLLPVSKVT